jgi:hypothetical protein
MGFERAPDLDWAPHPGLDLLGYRYPLTPGVARNDPSPTGRRARA